MTDVVAALRDLGRNLDHPTGEDLSARIVARLENHGPLPAPMAQRQDRRRVLLAVAAVVLAVLVVLALPRPREAVARWFGLGGVRLTLSEDGLPAGVGTTLDLGRPVTAEEAAGAASFDLALPDRAGPPSEAFAGRPPGGVSFLWAPTADLPEVAGSGVGLLLTEFPGTTDDALIVKELGPGTRVRPVSVDRDPAYWITGARHTVTYRDPEGDPQFDPVRLAGNTLLWTAAGVTYRMEADLSLAEMLALAESFAGVG
jgi:hypothetical protein